MLKSSLFNDLFEGGGSNRGSKYQDRVNAEIDNPRKDPKPVKPKQGKPVEGDLEKAFLKQKAEYGNLYVLDKTSLQTLQDELGNLPFRFKESGSKELLVALKNIMFSSVNKQIVGLVQSNESIAEIASLLEYSGPITIDPKADVIKQLQGVPSYALDSNNVANSPNAYPAIVGLVFPFIDANVLTAAIYDYPSVKEALKAYGAAYTGKLIAPIDWDAELPDFENFAHISDGLTVKILQTIKGMINGSVQSSFPSRLLKLAKTGSKAATLTLSKSVTSSIATNKHRNNIIKNIYYSLVTRALPYSADYLELDDAAVKQLMDNPDANTSVNPLSEKAQTLVAARTVFVEKNPFLYKGTLGHNAKTQLAFDYAKRVAFKKNKKEDLNQRTSEVVNKMFDEILNIVPGMKEHTEKLNTLLDSYFRVSAEEPVAPEASAPAPELKESKKVDPNHRNTISTSASDRAISLKSALDAYVAEGIQLLEGTLTDAEVDKIVARISQAKDLPKEVDRKAYVENYIKPFKEALLARFATIEEISAEDLQEIFTIGNALTDFIADSMTKKAVKEYILGFNNYLKSRLASGNDAGFKFIHAAAEIPLLLSEAVKKLKKVKKVDGDEEKEKKNPVKDSVEKAKIQYEAIHNARKKILDTKQILLQLPDIITAVLRSIGKSINNDLSGEALHALVAGIPGEQTDAEIDAALQHIVDNVYNAYFGPQRLGLLGTARKNDEDADVAIKMYVLNDLKDKVAKGSLIASGSLQSYVDLYDGLTEDFVNFINLAASIKDDNQGIQVDANGNISFNYALTSSSVSNSFFSKFFFGDLTAKVSSDPAITLAAHRVALQRLQGPMEEVFGKLQLEDILSPEVVKQYPELSTKIGAYFQGLINTTRTGITSAIKQIDDSIIAIAGGSFVKLYERETSPVLSYAIPASVDKDYVTNVTQLGSKALQLLHKNAGNDVAAKEFLRKLTMSAMSEELNINIAHAFDIISTAINIDIARQVFYGNEAQIAAVNGLIRKYQKEGNVEAINNIKAAKEAADKYVAALSGATQKTRRNPDGTVTKVQGTGLQGTQVLSGYDNHVDNPLLLAVLRKFDNIIKTDSWAVMAAEYSERIGKEKAEGTYFASDLNLVVAKTGIAYTRIGLFEAPETAAAVSEAVEPSTPSEEPVGKDIKPVGAPAFVQGKAGAKFNASSMLDLTKNLEKFIYGHDQGMLNKGQKHGENYKSVASYKEIFTKAAAASHTVVSTLNDFYLSLGDKASGATIRMDSELLAKNLKTMLDFFAVIGDANTLATANIPTQRRLMEILKTLQPTDFSPQFEETVIKVMDPKSEAFNKRMVSTFAKVPGASAFFELLRSGKTIQDIMAEVTAVLGSVATMDPDQKAQFLGMADIRDLDPEEEVAPLPAAAPKAPVAPASIEQKTTDFLQAITSRPIPGYAIPQSMGEYAKRYATLFDPNTYATVPPEIGQKLKAEAVRIAKSGGPVIVKKVEEIIKSGQTVNAITGQPVTNLIDVSGLYESKLALATALLEAEEQKLAKPVQILAAVLATRGVSATNAGLVTSAGKPYTFTEFRSLYWMLFATDSTLFEAAKAVNRLFGRKDAIEFMVGQQKYVYSKVIDFNRLKGLVDTYYKVEELNTESANEPKAKE